MNEQNGNGVHTVVHTMRKGKKNLGIVHFQVAEDTEKIPIDVVVVNNEWARIDQQMRTGDNGTVPLEMADEHQASAMRFAQHHLQCADIDGAEAWWFITRLAEEVEKLQVFFKPRLSEKPDSRGSTTVLTTSE